MRPTATKTRSAHERSVGERRAYDAARVGRRPHAPLRKDRDAFVPQRACDDVGGGGVVAFEDSRSIDDDGNGNLETLECLCQLDRHGAAADDEHARRQRGDVPDRLRVDGRDAEIERRGPAPGRDDDVPRGQGSTSVVAVQRQRVRIEEMRARAKRLDAVTREDRRRIGFSVNPLANRTDARKYACAVDAGMGRDAEPVRRTRFGRRRRRAQKRFTRHATVPRAVAAETGGFDEYRLRAENGSGSGCGQAGCARADYGEIVGRTTQRGTHGSGCGANGSASIFASVTPDSARYAGTPTSPAASPSRSVPCNRSQTISPLDQFPC